LNCKGRRLFVGAAIILVHLTSSVAFARDIEKPEAEKWRPRDGTYADPKSADNSCGDFGELIVELNDNSISGSEWSCKVTRLTDMPPGAIRLDLICNDYNLAEFINDPNPEERKFKEIMLLRKMGHESMFVRKTLNGKFKGPEWRTSYCPEEAQRLYSEAKARDKAEAERKAMEQRLRLTPWRPQDGIYATPGTNFEDRYLQSGDAIIELTERSIISGTDKCNVTFIRDEPSAIRLFATCRQEPNAQGSIARSGTGGSISAPSSSETIILRKTDDNAVFLQKSEGGDFTAPGKQLSYCGPDAQRKYAQQKAGK
jgi:hypothetical protein